MLIVGICDDEVRLCSQLEKEIDVYSFQNGVDIKIMQFHDIDSLLNSNIRLDVLFLDIRFGEQDSGIEAAFALRQKQKRCLIIFLSSMDKYLPTGYKVRAFRFLVKPVTRQLLQETMDDVLEFIREEEEEKTYLKIRSTAGNTMVVMDDIIAIESLPSKRTRQVYLERANAISTTERMIDFRNRLPSDRFVMVHKCFIINCAHVKSVQQSIITMRNGLKINLTRVYKDEFWFCQNKFVSTRGGRK